MFSIRADGKRVKSVGNMYTIASYFMIDRSDACNATTVRLPYQPIHEYVIEARKKGVQLSYMAVIIAGMLRTMCTHPFLNRFIANKKVYARNEVAIGMVVLRNGENAEESMGKMKFKLTDTIFDVNDKINEFVSNNRHNDANETDKIMKTLTKIPGLLNIGTTIIRFADKHGLLPKAIIDASPFHCSFVITNLASIRTNHIFHHVYNFGTCGGIYAIGNLEDVPKMKNGEIILERQMPIGIMCDERIGDGHSYARAFATLQKYMKNPALLESPPDEIIVDFDFEGLK